MLSAYCKGSKTRAPNKDQAHFSVVTDLSDELANHSNINRCPLLM